MAQRGNRPKYVAGVKREAVPPEVESEVPEDPNITHTAGGGGMGKTSPKLRKADARTERDAARETSADEPDAEASDEDFETETVPGPGPNDEDAGLATKRQLETHELKHSR